MDREIVLILGGARSGKSLFAQRLASQLGERVLFVATATPMDEEMERRIELHRQRRPDTWRTVETSTGVAAAIDDHLGDAEVVVLDCLSLLVSNVMERANDPHDIDAVENEMVEELRQLLDWGEATLIIVSNEVGMGVVPTYPSGRAFRDLLGRANQLVAERADRVYFLIAGIAQELKGKG